MLRELFTEILTQYPKELVKDNKSSNPYYKILKEKVSKVFDPIINPLSFSLKPLGGQANMRTNPYIAILAPGHQVSRGIYPVYTFNCERQTVFFQIGDSENHEPPDTLVKAFVQKAKSSVPDFKETNDAGYPAKTYRLRDLDEKELQDDLKRILRTYRECLDAFSKEIVSYTDAQDLKDAIERMNTKFAGRKFWMYAPGQNARHWDEFRQKGIMAIGWDDLGDLAGVSREDITKKLQKSGETDSSKKNDSLACFEFANEIKLGDIVIAKQGSQSYLGYGIVTSGYQFDTNRNEYKHVRRVDWRNVGVWQADFHLVSKTLTDITKYDYYVVELIELLKIEIDGPSRVASPDVPYTANPTNEALFIEDALIQSMVDALRHKKNVILQGPPGTGKTFVARRLAFLMRAQDTAKVKMVQFHQSYAYEDFIQGYRPGGNGSFVLKNGIFYDFCLRAQQDPSNSYFFVIDEINRGNLSKVFGEVMLLIEADKRGKEFAIPLTYHTWGDAPFYIPENVHLIGTMNTADRSLALVDYALRRRFAFITLTPQFSDKFIQFIQSQGVPEPLAKRIATKMTDLNQMITEDVNLGGGFTIGHSYFCHNPRDANDFFERIVQTEIEPLLREYWFDDEEKATAAVRNLLS